MGGEFSFTSAFCSGWFGCDYFEHSACSLEFSNVTFDDHSRPACDFNARAIEKHFCFRRRNAKHTAIQREQSPPLRPWIDYMHDQDG